MNELDYWRLSESLSLPEAAALIVGARPSGVHCNGDVNRVSAYHLKTIDSDVSTDQSSNFRATLSALAAALESGRLFGREQPYFPGEYDLGTIRVEVEDLCAWLEVRGLTTGFFFPDRAAGQPGYLDQNHPHYAPKLAAAIRAWEAVSSQPKRLQGTSPKQAIRKWLNENAALFGLTKNDGTPNRQGVEEISKLANWKPEGGASKTPGE